MQYRAEAELPRLADELDGRAQTEASAPFGWGLDGDLVVRGRHRASDPTTLRLDNSASLHGGPNSGTSATEPDEQPPNDTPATPRPTD